MFWNRKKRGANAIEFALTLPVFLVLFMGGMDWGWYFFMRAQVVNSTLIGCEMGSRVHPDSAVTAETTAENQMNTRFKELGWRCASLGSICDYEINTWLESGDVSFGEHKTLRCGAILPFTPLTGYVRVPKTITVSSEQRMEFQQ